MNPAHRSPHVLVALAVLAAALLSLAAAPAARATFPGRPGSIAFSRSVFGETEDGGGLFVHGPRHTDPGRSLIHAPIQSAPSFSADGRSISYAATGSGTESGSSHIFVVGSGGGAPRQLTTGQNYDSNPSFSPDGSQVVFDRQAGTGRTPHVYVVEVASGVVRQLTSGRSAEYEPSFTPDGRHIVFASNAKSDGEKNRSAIFWMNPDGSGRRILVDTPRLDSEPDVSPNGKRILFVSNKSGGNAIYVAGIKSGRVRPVTKPVPTCIRRSCFGAPVFSPDEKHIAALYSGTYSTSLVVMRAADGGGEKTFATGGTEEEGYGSRIGPPAWGPAPR